MSISKIETTPAILPSYYSDFPSPGSCLSSPKHAIIAPSLIHVFSCSHFPIRYPQFYCSTGQTMPKSYFYSWSQIHLLLVCFEPSQQGFHPSIHRDYSCWGCQGLPLAIELQWSPSQTSCNTVLPFWTYGLHLASRTPQNSWLSSPNWLLLVTLLPWFVLCVLTS